MMFNVLSQFLYAIYPGIYIVHFNRFGRTPLRKLIRRILHKKTAKKALKCRGGGNDRNEQYIPLYQR